MFIIFCCFTYLQDKDLLFKHGEKVRCKQVWLNDAGILEMCQSLAGLRRLIVAVTKPCNITF